jgi:hypothetical protein
MHFAIMVSTYSLRALTSKRSPAPSASVIEMNNEDENFLETIHSNEKLTS